MTGSMQAMMVWGEKGSGRRVLPAEGQWQIQLLEVGKQAWASEGKKGQRDGISSSFLLEPAARGTAASCTGFDFP